MSRLLSTLVVVLCAALGGCAGLPRLDLGKSHSQPPPQATICPGGLSAPLLAQPQPPTGAGVVKAQTQAESDAQAATLTWIRDLAAWGRMGWGRAADAQAWCARY